MYSLYGILVVALLLYSGYSKILGLINSLHSYFTRAELKHQRNAPETTGATSMSAHTTQKEDSTPNSNNTFYALIIGIDAYLNLDPLKGAAADADRVAEFLVNDLQVPTDQIINLRDQGASREGIIWGIYNLRDDPRIVMGDPIFIYYAGHGGSSRDPRGRREGRANEVQVIFPQDYGVCKSGPSDRVNYIPDYTVASLLNELAATKGNNITVVFDSCHSASGSRDALKEAPPTLRPRCAPVLYDVPCDIDSDIIKMAPNLSKSRAVDPILRTDQSSHILLAACGSREIAWERDGRGQFTTALLATLRNCGVQNLTYHNLLISLPKLVNQSPQCYGANKSRTLFDSRASSFKPTYIPVTLDGKILVLGAGSASGVVSRSVWELYGSTINDSPSLGRFIAASPQVSTTTLNPETDIARQKAETAFGRGPAAQPRLYARQVGAGVGNDLKVWFSDQARELLFQDDTLQQESPLKNTYTNEVGYIQHPREGADVMVEIHDSDPARDRKRIVFSICDPIAEENGTSKLDQHKPVHRGDVETVLFAAAKWNWHLRRTNLRHSDNSRQPMELLGMYKVGEKTRGNHREFFSTPEPILARDKGRTGIERIDFIARERDLYGIKLLNKKSVPLYVKVFYFDATDFSIVHLFGHSASNTRGDPELPASGELFIGDGSDGGSPLKFTVHSKKKVELGYLKIFWSTDPLELDDIPQASAFKLKSRRGVKPVDQDKAMKDWGAACLALVQHSPREG